MGLGWVTTGQSSSEKNPVLQQAVIPHSAARGHDTDTSQNCWGQPYTFLHVNLYSSLVSLLPNEPSSKALLSITTFQQCLPDQFSFRTVTSSHPPLCSAPLHEPSCCCQAPGELNTTNPAFPREQSWRVTTSPAAYCWVKMCARLCLSLVHWTSHYFDFRPTLGMWEAARPSVSLRAVIPYWLPSR